MNLFDIVVRFIDFVGAKVGFPRKGRITVKRKLKLNMHV